jgi:hypothetical protein
MHRDSDAKPLEGTASYSLVPLSRSMVFIMGTGDMPLYDRRVAAEYIFDGSPVADICEKNAITARKYGRYDHERTFSTLRSFVSSLSYDGGGPKNPFTSNPLAHQVVTRLYAN